MQTTPKPSSKPILAKDAERDESLKLWVVIARAYGAISAHVEAHVAQS